MSLCYNIYEGERERERERERKIQKQLQQNSTCVITKLSTCDN